MIRRAVLPTILVATVSCSPRSRSHPNVFVRAGVFPSPDGAFELVIDTSNKLVNYVVRSASGKDALFKGNAGSIYSYWAFSWGKANALWVHSSDIGGCYWSRTEDGAWRRGSLDEVVTLKGYEGMPEELFERMPESLTEGFAH